MFDHIIRYYKTQYDAAPSFSDKALVYYDKIVRYRRFWPDLGNINFN